MQTTLELQGLVEAALDVMEGRTEDKMQAFVFDKMENSDMDIDELRDAFVKKFGKRHMKHFDKFVDEFMG